MPLINKICLYSYDIIREEFKSNSFKNLKSNKDNKIIFVEGETMQINKEKFADIENAFIRLKASESDISALSKISDALHSITGKNIVSDKSVAIAAPDKPAPNPTKIAFSNSIFLSATA